MRRSWTMHVFALSRRLMPACLLACGFACDDADSPRPCDWNRIGAVHGYVLAAGQPPADAVRMTLSTWHSWTYPRVDATTETDSTGWYEFLVPEGTYTLKAETEIQGGYYSASGGLVYLGPRDTLAVTREPLRADVDLGAATLEIAMPPLLNDHPLGMRFTPVLGCPAPEGRVAAMVRDGLWNPGPVPLAPGVYRLEVVLPGQSFWLPGTLDPFSATQLEVRAGEPASYSGEVAAPWILRGEVRGAWQSLALSAPQITAFTTDSLRYISTRAAADGTFRMQIFPTLPVRLLISINRPHRWVGGPEFADAETFVAAPGESVTIPSLVYGAIECRLQPPHPMLDLTFAVTLLDEGGRSVIPAGFWPTSFNPLTYPFLDAGTYFLQLTPTWPGQDWGAQWFDQADLLSEALPIEVPPDGGVARITMVLSTGGTISGRVLEASGAPAGGRRVELFAADDSTQGTEYSAIYTVTDEESGQFAMRQLYNGDYRVGVRHTLRTLVWYPGTLVWNEAAVLTIAEHGEISSLEWSLVE